MAIKKVLLSKKVNNVVYDIFPKTAAEIVTYGESTVAATLAQFATDLADRYTKGETDAAIQAESTALYNKIMGITAEDGATVTEAYDTLKEVAAWIDEHGEIAAAFTTDIAALKTAVGEAPAEGVEGSGLLKAMAEAQAAIEANDGDIEALQTAVEALETAVGDANAGLVKAMADAQAAIEELQGKADDYEERIAALEAVGSTKVEQSETNGNIKVDGQEVVVYTHPETHSAEMIVETDDRKFVTAAEKDLINGAAAVRLVASQDEVVNETDLYMVEL
jgi:hypothetical protein